MISKETAWMIAQCSIAIVIGSFVFLELSAIHANPKTPFFGGLICGFVGSWAVMFLYIWARYGWKAARSMSMGP